VRQSTEWTSVRLPEKEHNRQPLEIISVNSLGCARLSNTRQTHLGEALGIVSSE